MRLDCAHPTAGPAPSLRRNSNPTAGRFGVSSSLPATPCFNLGLLKDIRKHDQQLETNGGKVTLAAETHQVNYYVLGSRQPRVFNLGGDLALFVLLIKSRDREALAHYAKLCIDNVYPRIHNFFSPTLTTISLVQGDALGGGFECALSSDVIVAEESAQLGLPRNPVQPVSRAWAPTACSRAASACARPKS